VKTSPSFQAAPMAAVFVVLSGLVLAIPIIFTVIGLGDPRLRVVFLGTAVMVAAAALGVWVFYKPKRFLVDDAVLTIEFPMRTIEISRTEITSARVLSRDRFRETLGFALRVGIGGLFGVFGYLWSNKLGWVTIYATSTDDWVLIERRGSGPLILTPKDAEGLVAALS
jgi:hypothetical protein